MPRSVRSNRPVAEPPGETAISAVWLFGVGLLLAARYLQPTEAAVFGDTLWQAQLWLVLAALWCWGRWRSDSEPLRLSLLDGIVGLLVVGHALSTIPVLVVGGDRRAAVNIAWEWAGLAAMLFLVRQVFDRTELRRPLGLVAAMVVGLACLGIWQHHVALPETASRFEELNTVEAQLEQRIANGDATAQERQQLAEVRRELLESGVPLDPAARRQWVNRVKHSTEPFATFGLANTLGGLLAAGLPLLIAAFWTPRRSFVAVIAASVAVVFYCLVLTKSRTAWVGLAAGGVAALALFYFRGRFSRAAAYVAAGSIGAAILLGLAVLATGGLDREVFLEAPKSLRYRIDYWTGTFGVLSERPLLGTGPGNFRSHYLEHRPVGASEEVAAPHNLLLDVWVSGGLLSLLALVGLLAYVAIRFVLSDDGAVSDRPNERAAWRGFEWGSAAAFPVVVLLLFLSGSGFDLRLLAIWPVVCAALFCLIRSNNRSAAVVGAGAGFVALTVHLLGADGVEFPAVAQSLLLFGIVADRPRAVDMRSPGSRAVPTCLFGGLALACFVTGLAPVLNGRALLVRAESAYAAGDPTAGRLLAEAADADRLATRPPLLQAELATSRALASDSVRDFEAARRGWEAVLATDPRSLYARQRFAELLLDRSARVGDNGFAGEAASLFEQAVGLSPTDSELRLRLARALDRAGRRDPAAEQARAALRLDAVNRAAMHTDLLFDEVTREELQRLAGVGKPVGSP